MVALALDVLSVVFELVIYYVFFRCFFGKGKFPPFVMALIYFADGAFSLYLSLGQPIGIIRHLGYLSVILLLAPCYEGPRFVRYFLAFLLQTISIMIEQSYGVLLRPVREALAVYGTAGENLYYFLGIVLSNGTILLLVKLFSTKKAYLVPKQASLKFPLYAFLLLIFPQSMSYSADRLRDLMALPLDAKSNSAIATVIVLLTLFNIAYFFLFGFILQYYQKQRENIVLQKQIEQERHYHDVLLRKHQQLQGLRHDMKQQFDTIASLLCGKHVQDALTIAKNQSGKLAMTAIVQSGHPLVDTILTLKEDQAQQANARFKCHISAAIEVGNIDADDLASLLGNILDNAIEAVAKIPQPDQREIRCQLAQDNHYLYIVVSNTVGEDIPIVNNHIATTKTQQDLHGYGLLNIKNIVKKYDGRCHLSCANKTFTIKIILPVETADA